MIYILQLIYLQEGQEEVFEQFEAVAIPLIAAHNGQLLLRIRPGAASLIEGMLEQPYEIHLVTFGQEKDFEAFLGDETRKAFLHLKERSIRAALLIRGTRIG